MMQNIKKNTFLYTVLFLFVFFTIWWIFLNFVDSYGTLEHRQIFSALYGIMAFFGGLIGLRISKNWGGAKSYIGKAILFLSIGLLLQEFGQLVYSYYNFIYKIEIPYPSLGDLGYFGTIPFYILGGLELAKATGIQLSLKSFMTKIWAVAITLILLLGSYFIFLQGYAFNWSHPLTIFLDFGYPFGQAIYISIALVTFSFSWKLLGGVMKNKILFVLFGFLLQYLADFMWLYKASQNSWTVETVAGTNEYLYFLAYFIIALAIISLGNVFDNVKNESTV